MKIQTFFTVILLLTLSQSIVAQISTGMSEDGVHTLNIDSQNVSLKSGGKNLIILDKHNYIVGIKRNNETHEIKLWNLDNGNSESTYKIISKNYDNCEEDEEVPSIDGIIATHDQSKIIIYIEYSTPYNPKYEKTKWHGTKYYDNPIKPTFLLVCYSIIEKKIIWETERQRKPLYSDYFWNDKSGCNIIVSYDDKYIYFVGDKNVAVINTETGKTENDLPFLFPEQLNLSSGYSRLIICPSQSGRYFACFHDADYKTFNIYRGTTVHVWDDIEKKLIADIYVKGKGVRGITFTPDEQYLLTVDNNYTFRLISLQDKKIKITWEKIKSRTYYFSNGFYLSESYPQYLFADDTHFFDIMLYPQMKLLFKSGKRSRGALSREGRTLVLSEAGYLILLDTSDWSIKWYVPL